MIVAGRLWWVLLTLAVAACSSGVTVSTVVVQVRPPTSSMEGLAGVVERAPFASQFLEVVAPYLPAGGYTLFAPSNDAYATFYESRVNIAATPSDLAVFNQKILKNHLLDSVLTFTDLTSDSQIVRETQSGREIRILIAQSDGLTYLLLPGGGRAKIQSVDLRAGEGIIHIIDRVIE